MNGAKVSGLDPTQVLGENDLFYVVRSSVEGGLESKKIAWGDLASMFTGLGLPGLEYEQVPTVTPSEFYNMVWSEFAAKKPTHPTCKTTFVTEPTKTTAAAVTTFPVSEGKYVMFSGPNVMGDGKAGVGIFYIRDSDSDMAVVMWYSADTNSGGGESGFTLKGRVSSMEALPADPQKGDCWFVGGVLYHWDGVVWGNLGDFTGPQGLTGDKGDTGAQGPKGDKGDPGLPTFAIKSGNFSSNYPNDLTKPNAHGTIGTKEYWKYTLNLDKATYNKYPTVNVYLQELPCDASGVPVPYTLHYYFNSSGIDRPPNIVLMLILHEPATQLLSNNTGTYEPLGLVNDVMYEPHYSVTYWY